MPVPSLVTDLSTTAASNSPAGSDNVFPDLDNYLRAMSAFIASIRDNSGNGWVSPYLPLAGGTVTGATTFSNTVTGAKFIPTGTSATGNGMYLPATNTLGFSTNGTQAMTLSASGQLGIGTTNPGRMLHVKSSTGSMTLEGTSVGGYIEIVGPTTTNYIGTPAAISSGSTTDLGFYLNGSERARITSDGDLCVGRTAAISSERLCVEKDLSSAYVVRFRNTSSTTPFGLFITYPAAAPNGTGNLFLRCDDNAATRAEIRSNGGLANYSGNNVNLSDRREKINFAPAKDYLDTICAIPVQTFEYIDQSPDDPGLTLGVVAQDVQAVAPELVMESNWGTEDNPKMRLSIYQTDLQYALMKCIQELKAQNDDLRARVAALEAA